ncbi:MAG: aminotransferase class I/II-fold pyridoxal phosphate-dependent enzyme [Oscillospiraceae bacterium]|nr:aminotransferase class I/II-fold pyridoxal phosphate-dependent enzyme [Oscillospiraceae bacterium]
MKYDFTSILDRHGKDAIAIDAVGGDGWGPGGPKEGFDVIPMWVADMNFPVVPTVTRAIMERAAHPAFGYFSPTQAYYEKIIRWQERRNGVQGLKPEHIGYENGVLGGVISALNVLCSRGDNVLVHSPTYIGFTHSLENNGYNIVHSPLKPDETGIWRMDLADMEEKIVANNIHAMIFCSPHNPVGRVWEKSEIEAVIALCEKLDVYVISDEIWSDIILEGCHVPTQSVSPAAKMRTIALYAPSKTFNLAGLVGSYHIIYNDRLRHRVDKESSLSHYNSMNVLSMHALLGAYEPEGYEWVDELRQVIGENVGFACDFIAENFPGVTLSRPQGTYMLFLDCTGWCEKTGRSIDQVIRAGWDVGVAWQDGREFHGPCHIRMNLALPKSRVEEAFLRLKKYVFC